MMIELIIKIGNIYIYIYIYISCPKQLHCSWFTFSIRIFDTTWINYLEMDTKNPHMAKNLKFNTKEFKNEMYHCYKNIVKHSKKFCSVCGGYFISINFPPKNCKGYYAYSSRVRGRKIMPIYRCKNPPTIQE